MRIEPAHAVNFLALTRGKILVRIEPPASFDNSLATQDLVDPGNASAKLVGGIEERGVRVRDLLSEGEQFAGHGTGMTFRQREMTNRGLGPYRPMAEQSAGKANCCAAEIELGQQVQGNVVIVARV